MYLGFSNYICYVQCSNSIPVIKIQLHRKKIQTSPKSSFVYKPEEFCYRSLANRAGNSLLQVLMLLPGFVMDLKISGLFYLTNNYLSQSRKQIPRK